MSAGVTTASEMKKLNDDIKKAKEEEKQSKSRARAYEIVDEVKAQLPLSDNRCAISINGADYDHELILFLLRSWGYKCSLFSTLGCNHYEYMLEF
jgi:hypothetical protein